MSKLRLAVLLSGSGTTLQNLVDCIRAGTLDASVEVVIASRPGLKGTERAQQANLPNFVVNRKEYPDIPSFSREVFHHIDAAKPDLICLAGWLSLLDIPDAWVGRMMNIHPALLPSFGGKGMYGHHVHEAVLAHGCKIAGCTVHFVDRTYDTGPIIVQRTCPVLEDDTPDTLAARVFEQEKLAYPEAIRLFQAGRLTIDQRRVHIRPA
jgi:formyltetrahydrofolate-dependent phosphoribosylglycinamide formyltransferase